MRLVTALLATSFALSSAAVGEAQLLPSGKFAARDGRPGPGKKWEVSHAQGLKLAAAINAVAAQTPIVIDYEHQTLRADANGKPAPAAGWIHSAQWRDGQGLFAQVEWTAAAKASIAAGEYRYISPVIVSDDETGEVTGVLLAALVNHPALLGMEAVATEVMAQLATRFPPSATPPHVTAQQEPPAMSTLLAALIAGLGLAAGADDAAVIAAVTALKAKADTPPPKAALPAALSTALGLQADADEVAALSAVTTLKAGSSTTTQLVASLQGEVNALKAENGSRALTELLNRAVKEEKIAPASREQYAAIGRNDLAALTALIAALPAIPGLSGQSGGRDRGPAQQIDALSGAEALRVAAQMGVSPDAWNKHLAAKKAATV